VAKKAKHKSKHNAPRTRGGMKLRRVGAKGTGWIAARRVKIVKRRGHPAQVLVERPHKRSKKGR
jgi:hypothetical protein